MMIMNSEWRKNLKIGDTVLVIGGYVDDIGEVVKLTKTQLTVSTDSKLRRFIIDSGREFGGNSAYYHRCWIRPVNDTDLQRIRLRKLNNLLWRELDRVRKEKLTESQLERLIKVAEEVSSEVHDEQASR